MLKIFNNLADSSHKIAIKMNKIEAYENQVIKFNLDYIVQKFNNSCKHAIRDLGDLLCGSTCLADCLHNQLHEYALWEEFVHKNHHSQNGTLIACKTDDENKTS